jgi:chromosome segregation ATPase
MGQKKNCDIIHCEEIAPNGCAYCDAHHAMLYGGDAPIMVMNQLKAEIKWYKTSVEDGGGYFGTLAKANKELEAKVEEQAAEIERLNAALKRVSDYNGRIEYKLAEQAAELKELQQSKDDAVREAVAIITAQAAKNKTHMEFMEATMNETGNLLDQSQIELARFRGALEEIKEIAELPPVDGAILRIATKTLEKIMGDKSYADVLIEELKVIVQSYAYDRGHSAGQEEVSIYESEMMDDLKPIIRGIEQLQSNYDSIFKKTMEDR